MSKHKTPVIRYAGIFSRFSSYFIDQIIIAVMVGILGGIYSWVLSNDTEFAAHLPIYLLVAFLYYILFTSGNWQATPGMRMVGLYVVDKNYKKLDIISAIVRFILYMINLVLVAFIALFIGKLLSVMMSGGSASVTDVLVFNQSGKLQGELVEMKASVSSGAMSFIIAVVVFIKAFLIALPMFLTAKRQTLYDYFMGIGAVKGSVGK